MIRIVAGLSASIAFASAALAGAPSVSIVTPVVPGKGQAPRCPVNYSLVKCSTPQQCASALRATQQVCVATQNPAPAGRRRAVAPPSKNCPVMPPGSKVQPKC
jgi:hypothetical protein